MEEAHLIARLLAFVVPALFCVIWEWRTRSW